MMYMKNSLIAGVLLASPWIFWQLWMFIAPGLYKKEKALAVPFIFFSSALCFAGGAIFGYKLVFPEAFTVLLGFSDETLVATLVRERLHAVLSTHVACVRHRVRSSGHRDVPGWARASSRGKQLLKFSRWWIVVAAFISMLLTPQDVYTMVMMLIPLVLLYFVGVWHSRT